MRSGKDPIQAHAEFLAENTDIPNVPNLVLLILYDLRVPVHCAGFRYLKDAIPAALRQPSHIVETELFDDVGSRYIPQVSFRNMDTSVRDVVQMAWRERTYERWRKYMPEYIMERRKTPTNLEFISCIVYFLEYWQNCCEKEAGHEAIT